jgi:hypothetical protein
MSCGFATFGASLVVFFFFRILLLPQRDIDRCESKFSLARCFWDFSQLF